MSTSNQGSMNPDNNTPPKDHSKIPMLISGVIIALIIIGLTGMGIMRSLRSKHAAPPPPVIGSVSAPAFIDQNGEEFPISQLDGRIWIADFIFTRCGGQCPVMTIHMKRLQDWLEENEMGNVRLVSMTVDPENDTPEVLKRYADNIKADPNRWHFLTGEREPIYDYIINEFKLGAEENQDKPVEDLFVHSEMFVLVDRDRNIRGYFSGVSDEEMQELRTAIEGVSYEKSPPPVDLTEPTPTPVAQSPDPADPTTTQTGH